MYRIKTKDGWYVSGVQHLTKVRKEALTYYNRVDAEAAAFYFELKHSLPVKVEEFEGSWG